MKKIVYITLPVLLVLFIASCNGEENTPVLQEESLEISFRVDNFLKNDVSTRATRATDPGTTAEQQIDNVFLFLFDENGANPIKYFITPTPSAGGSLKVADKKVTVNVQPNIAGKRLVHLVANCADLQADLNGVTTVAGLNNIIRTTAQPWGSNLTTPLLMYGAATALHDFEANRTLDHVTLTRTVAKLELNITLTDQRQKRPLSGGVAQYQYQLINFDTKTYLIKPVTKPATPASSEWNAWDAAGTVTSYTLTNEKVTALKLVTYLNEIDVEGTGLKLKIPFGGLLPPPETVEEVYPLDLTKIVRNHWYTYDIEI